MRSDLDGFPGAGGKRLAPKEYFMQYVSRDVVSIAGLQDTGKLQGGTNRCARKLIAGAHEDGTSLVEAR
ncbi:hypothetical protein N7505_003672 [Penicillium chrysogenum]|jgi:hypothetical protein|uniref:Uncharacterized protein n=1 Tax=Penicillium chrysogenum TaxID=5076 RepID=A0ABQ8WQX3_PENCH|nr:hypothetical protein N7505_003672 [Penicillium chrysogenum]KAJ5285619.1 hypothetical protein N7524_000925 [Penicillium chrysogenum]